MKWTDEQKNLLFTEMTNEEIAERTGRSFNTVKKMRAYYTGHSVEKSRWKPTSFDRIQAGQGEAHVIATAIRIGAKILDVG